MESNMTNTITTHDMDIAWDYYDTPEFHADLAKYNLTHTLLELEGPGGGNPNITLTGTIENLTAALTEWYGHPEDVNFYITGEW